MIAVVIWFGWYDAGHVDRLGRESVATEFFYILIPVMARSRSRYLYEGEDGSATYYEIPLQRRSLIAGYLRTPCWLGGWMLGFAGAMLPHWGLLAAGLAICAIAAVLTFVVGRLSPPERERRELLKRAAGLGMPPELMRPQLRDDLRDRLAVAWFDEHRVDWRTSITRGQASEVLVAIAEYDRAPALASRARRNLIDAEGN